MEPDIRDIIRETQERVLRRIVELVPRDKRQEAEALIDQFHQAAKAIAVMTPGIDTRYSSCPHVIDAIKLYLTDIDRPASRSEIMVEVVRRGFRPKNAAQTAGNISKSLKMYLAGRAATKRELKEIGGRVGFSDWPDERFPVEDLPIRMGPGSAPDPYACKHIARV